MARVGSGPQDRTFPGIVAISLLAGAQAERSVTLSVAVGMAGAPCPSARGPRWRAKGRPGVLVDVAAAGWHMPATWDRPRVSQGWFTRTQVLPAHGREGALRLTWPRSQAPSQAEVAEG